jgi:type IV pilus assembly protein PilB
MGIEPFITVSSLACIMAQRLARVLCHHCKQPYVMTAEELALIPGFPLDSGEKTVTLYRPSRCVRCNNIGYRGRVGIYEVLFVDETIQQLIMERRSAREIKTAAVAGGMVTLRRDGLMKAKQGITSLEEIMRVVL